jgi:AcrR family transcriptional regulator
MRRSSSKAAKKTPKPAIRPRSPRAPKPGRASKKLPGTRKEAILDAALSVFAEDGYQAARLDDVARRADVAKGTLYLYFDDKEKLFEEVVRGAISPVLERISLLAAAPDMPIEQALEALFSVFEKEVLGTRRKLIVRLIIAEGPRFPRVAEFYYQNVVGRVMPLVATIAKRAAERGELSSDAVARYPQLIAAPLLVAVIWDALFARIEPLDVAEFFRAHREVLTGKKRRTSPP